MFPHRRKTGPLRHEEILSRKIQPVARQLGLPHITWRLPRHWGTTQLVEKRVPIKAAQQRLGHSRPDILLKHYTHVLDASAEFAAETLSSQLTDKAAKKAPRAAVASRIKAKKTTAHDKDSPESGSQTAANYKRWIM